MITAGIRILPILRWAGGKKQLLRYLIETLPTDIDSRFYCEPFLGAGSLFFAVQPKSAMVSDANERLIEMYREVSERPGLVSRYLATHRSNHSEKYYYEIRAEYNASKPSAAQSARFIYLNKSCFNGLFRVNKQGQFNVPYGKLETLALPTLEHLNEASKIIKRAEVRACSFEVALENASKDCFFYLDPPYPPLNGTAYFTHYTADRFNNAQQEQLAEHVHVLDRRGAKVMITNADTPMIRQLYSKYNQRDVPVFRFVTCKRKRHVVRELIITNY